ncbi:MAG: hypothetical protein M3Z37_09195 [Candidatus Eremiobacteraeota bacterium]|nr:hypothetical protein [Candidatus Eremiobacteraeota bacterium]
MTRTMSRRLVAAAFGSLRHATGAVHWFRNQGIAADAIVIGAQSPDGRLRATQRGDNLQSGLRWVVALDLDASKFDKAVALETLTREGGAILKHIPADLPLTEQR